MDSSWSVSGSNSFSACHAVMSSEPSFLLPQQILVIISFSSTIISSLSRLATTMKLGPRFSRSSSSSVTLMLPQTTTSVSSSSVDRLRCFFFLSHLLSTSCCGPRPYIGSSRSLRPSWSGLGYDRSKVIRNRNQIFKAKVRFRLSRTGF